MAISTLPTTITAGQTGHATIHNNTNTAVNSIINRVQDAMTGATSAGRIVGAVSGAAPASGTFALGDLVIDQTGGTWICTSAGSPGTWSKTAPLTSTAPVALGSAAAGTATQAARQDHVHPTTGLALLSTYAAKGDIVSATGSGAVQTNTVGANNTVLVADSAQAGGVKWATAQLLSTYTTKGDIITATGSGAVQRNAVGADNTALIAASGQAGGVTWGAVQLLSTYTTKGDIITATGSGAVQRNAVGANNTVLVADSTAAGNVKWQAVGATPEVVETNATVTTTLTIGALTLGSIKNYTLTGSTTFTMPTAAAGISFTIKLTQDGTGSRVPTFTGVKWAGGAAPTFSTGASKTDVVSFICVDGTNWYGMPPVLDVR